MIEQVETEEVHAVSMDLLDAIYVVWGKQAEDKNVNDVGVEDPAWATGAAIYIWSFLRFNTEYCELDDTDALYITYGDLLEALTRVAAVPESLGGSSEAANLFEHIKVVTAV